MIHRIVPNLKVCDAGAGHDFYVDFLGLEKAFDLGWIASFRSPENRSIQVSLVSGDASAPENSAISVNVDDVDAAYREARRRGYEVVYPLTEEPWGTRRFFVRRPERRRRQRGRSPRLTRQRQSCRCPILIRDCQRDRWRDVFNRVEYARRGTISQVNR
jgi:predicted enzyme related to lactoylglutathione lyase